MALLSSAAQYVFNGNPNGNVAGQLSDQTRDSSTSGSLYMCTVAGNAASAVWQQIGDGNNIPTFTGVVYNTAGTLSLGTVFQVAAGAGINPGVTQYFIPTGDITVRDIDAQNLLVGIVASGFSMIMPNPLMTNPWKNGYAYYINVQPTNGVDNSSSIALLNSDSTPILDWAANPVIMQPGDTWFTYFAGSFPKGKAYFIANNNILPQSGILTGEFFPLNGGSTISVSQQTFSWEVVNHQYAVYTLPSFSSSISGGDTSIVFKTTTNTLFPTSSFPATLGTTPILVFNNGTATQGGLRIDGSQSTGQIRWDANTSGSAFTSTVLFPPITMTVSL